MANAGTRGHAEPWRRRLFIPHYQVGEAAKYARISPQTVAKWHASAGRHVLSQRDARSGLSYMQLIEVAVVAAFRKAGATLKQVRETREYVSTSLQSEFPFAEYRFKLDGKRLIMDYQQVEGDGGRGKLLRPDQGGQLAWADILGRLQEFDYEKNGIAIRWRVGGDGSDIVIDPRVAFGAPTVAGTPTWVIRGRWEAGESMGDIADDFDLQDSLVRDALEFEGIKPDTNRQDLWVH